MWCPFWNTWVCVYWGAFLFNYAEQSGRRTGVYLHQFNVQPLFAGDLNEAQLSALFIPAFKAIWQKRCDSDSFNRLIVAAGIPYYAANMLRAYAAYLKQTLFFKPRSDQRCPVKTPARYDCTLAAV